MYNVSVHRPPPSVPPIHITHLNDEEVLYNVKWVRVSALGLALAAISYAALLWLYQDILWPLQFHPAPDETIQTLFMSGAAKEPLMALSVASALIGSALLTMSLRFGILSDHPLVLLGCGTALLSVLATLGLLATMELTPKTVSVSNGETEPRYVATTLVHVCTALQWSGWAGSGLALGFFTSTPVVTVVSAMPMVLYHWHVWRPLFISDAVVLKTSVLMCVFIVVRALLLDPKTIGRKMHRD